MEDYRLEQGLAGQARITVNDSNTAMAYGSGTVDVFATPSMIALMEEAAIKAVDHKLPAGLATVGTRIDVKHMAATPVGMSVTANAELIETDGPKLKFKVEAYDGKEKIGEGIHYRFVINLDQLKQRSLNKLK
ncbi:MAG: thioesterase family protein [Actinomycetia bacterium]|nr:thioesterase family protein [Actinomycetes bacterium]